MEPNDLKNPEGLKSSKKSDLKNSEKNIVSEEVEKREELHLPEKNGTDLADETTVKKEVVEIEEKVEEEVNVVKEEVEETAIEPVEEATDTINSTPLETEEKVVVEEIEIAGKQENIEKEVNVVKEEEVGETTIEPVEESTNSALIEEKEKITASVVDNNEEVATETDAEKVMSVTDRKEEKVEEEANVASKNIKAIVKKRKAIDYTNYSQIKLVNALRDVLENNETRDIKNEVEAIKSVFYKNLNENIESEKKIFIEEGGLKEEFVAQEDPYENDIKKLLRNYREIRIDFNKRMENEKENNLKLKYEVIEKIKGLINSEESINKTFNDFRNLQEEWREIGLVPQSKMKNLWDTYHFHVENFYDYIKINRELRDLDLKKNLEIKIELCEHAEELLIEPSIIKAFNILQKYHEQWREAGPVPREQKDNIWERFKSATSKINKKHQDFFESRKVEQKKNLEAKTALCEKVEEICNSEVSNYRDWDEKSKELVKLQKVWRTIGFAPKKDNNKIYERFRMACDKFFDNKRNFYSKNKEIQQNNMQLKIDLCVQAESLKDNGDWKKTTQDFIDIQNKWKEIGPIPRKHSDHIWKRFRAACDFFFDKKSEHFSGMDTEQNDNLKKKEDLIEQAINFKSLGNVEDNLEALKDFQRQWTEIGHVPFKKKDEVQIKFREAINKLFDELNIGKERRNLLKFRSKMSSYSESNRGQNKMRMERDKYMSKLKQLENDHVLLDNNIGFFAKSKNADALIVDIKKKLEISKQKIEFLKDKIRVIDEMDNE